MPSSFTPAPYMASGTNSENARQHNRRVILEAIRLNGRLTRAELARLTALTPQAVSNITTELRSDGWLRTHAPERQGRGQPPVPLSIEPGGAYSIGCHVDPHGITVVLLDLAGRPHGKVIHEVDYPDLEIGSTLIEHAVARLLERAGIARSRLLGMAVALPGPFGATGLASVGPTMLPEWLEVDLKTRLSERTGLSVLVENDASAAAMGERLYGNAVNLRHFVQLFIGRGLGAGLYLQDRLYTGCWNNAGEIGHVVVVPGGRDCYCGNAGCLERYVSLQALFDQIDLPAGRAPTPEMLSGDDPCVQQGVRRWLADAVPALRQAIGMLESTLDPETIIVSGSLPAGLLKRLLAALEPLPGSISRRDRRSQPRLQAGRTGNDAVALGAAALVVLGALSPCYETLLK